MLYISLSTCIFGTHDFPIPRFYISGLLSHLAIPTKFCPSSPPMSFGIISIDFFKIHFLEIFPFRVAKVYCIYRDSRFLRIVMYSKLLHDSSPFIWKNIHFKGIHNDETQYRLNQFKQKKSLPFIIFYDSSHLNDICMYLFTYIVTLPKF